MQGDEDKMTEYYDKLKNSSVSFVYPLPFHPYYRAAKLAQRSSECQKAIFYFKKALSFYEGFDLDADIKASASMIIYDMATVCLYMHEYAECESLLLLSEKYGNINYQQKAYVSAILNAAKGRLSEARGQLEKLDGLLRRSCETMVFSIASGKDPHYCVCPQDRSSHGRFIKNLRSKRAELEALIDIGKTEEAECILSKELSGTFAFMKKDLSVRIEVTDGRITAYCKNYFVKTLIAEYEALFSSLRDDFDNRSFVSVSELGRI